MDRFFVITNADRDRGCEKALQIEEYLTKHGRICDHVAIERDSAPDSKEISKIREIPDDTEAVLVLGGDGTFIQSAGILAPRNIPLIGVNLGHRGYLAEIDKENITDALEKLMNDEYTVGDRMMLSGTPVIDGKNGSGIYAVNDIVVRTSDAGVGKFSIEVNGTHLTTMSADGMIVATPTGSTAYNMSAGGPIVQPGMDCIVLTPVCAHSLQKCPCIVSGTSTISLRLLPERKQTVELQIDGIDCSKLESGDEIIVTGSEKRIRLLRIHSFRFFTLLQSKLIEWGSVH